jgi:hypothetical protein
MSSEYWISVDEAASWLSFRPEQVVCLVREGILAGRGRRTDDMVVLATDVQQLAAALSLKPDGSQTGSPTRVAPCSATGRRAPPVPPAAVRPCRAVRTYYEHSTARE